MSLVRMALTNYRCFLRRQDIELRPVTVVLGRNNSGKSALVRAPLVLSTGFRTDSPAPLDLDLLGEEILDSFTDLIYGGRPHGSIRIELEFDDNRHGRMTLDATVQNVDEYRLQVVSSLYMRVGQREARLEWERDDPRSDQRLYTITADDATYPQVPVRFTGLLPGVVKWASEGAYRHVVNRGPSMSSPANRLILPTPPGVSLRRALLELPAGHEAILDSHGIPAQALAFLREGNGEGFIKERAAHLAGRERVFMSELGVQTSSELLGEADIDTE